MAMRPAVVVAMLITSLLEGGCAGHPGEFEPFREVSCFEAARVSLTDAISAAEAAGGRALDADYRQDEELGCLQNEPGVYDITLLAAGRIGAVSVDARTRQVGPQQDAGVMNALFGGGPRFEGSHAEMARMVPRLSVDISQAIGIAQRQGGKAMVAWIEEKNGRIGYTVKLVERGRVRVTWVDGERSG